MKTHPIHVIRYRAYGLLMLIAFLLPLVIAERSWSSNLGELGTVDFPTSARSKEAQAHFMRGVAALHSFWYPVALEEFQEATRIEPDFMMGYWGEAMAHNHPIWGDPQETEAARKVLGKVKITPALSARERAYLQAVKLLYGEGDKRTRDKAYAAAMDEIHQAYPNDLEAAAFHALALLGTVHADDPAALRTRMYAGALAQEVYRKAPNHPGGAHYIIHAFDDPDHAILALPAARRYAGIAPAAHHALHMPAHIFLQLGMWAEAVASNEASWAASDRWVREHNLSIAERDTHSLHWLLYVSLQQGRFTKAQEVLALMRVSLAEFPKDDMLDLFYGMYAERSMAAAYVVATQQWDAAETILSPAHAVELKATDGAGSSDQASAGLVRTPTIFARGLAAAMKGSPAAQTSMAELARIRSEVAGKDLPFNTRMDHVLEIQELEIDAAARAAKKDFNEAIEKMRKAAALVEGMPPPSGPPPLIKPVHELFGEILLLAGQPKEAAQQFATSLYLHPDRAHSLLGAARAAAQQDQVDAAAKDYAKLVKQWRQADAEMPALIEARTYLSKANERRAEK